MSNMQSDLDYIKSMAEAGARGPMRNGATLFWAGLLYGLAAIGQYGIVVGWLPRTNLVNMAIWLGASALFTLAAVLCGVGRNRIKGAPGSLGAASAWSGVGIAVVGFIICVAIVANVTHAFTPMDYIIAPVVLLIYGMGWWVSALTTGTGWLKLISAGCFVAAIGVSFMAGQAEQLLAYAGCLFGLAMIPGLVLMRANRA